MRNVLIILFTLSLACGASQSITLSQLLSFRSDFNSFERALNRDSIKLNSMVITGETNIDTSWVFAKNITDNRDTAEIVLFYDKFTFTDHTMFMINISMRNDNSELYESLKQEIIQLNGEHKILPLECCNCISTTVRLDDGYYVGFSESKGVDQCDNRLPYVGENIYSIHLGINKTKN